MVLLRFYYIITFIFRPFHLKGEGSDAARGPNHTKDCDRGREADRPLQVGRGQTSIQPHAWFYTAELSTTVMLILSAHAQGLVGALDLSTGYDANRSVLISLVFSELI